MDKQKQIEFLKIEKLKLENENIKLKNELDIYKNSLKIIENQLAVNNDLLKKLILILEDKFK